MRATSTKSGGTSNVADHFAPRIVVGNVPAGDPNVAQVPPFQYIPDPGDGSGIVAALAVAVAGYDVRVRPGVYTLPVGTVLAIPTGVSLSGDPPGPLGIAGGVLITASAGDANTAQDAITLVGVGSSLRDVQVRVPAGAQGGLNGDAIIKLPPNGGYVRGVVVDMTFGGAGQRNTDVAFGTGTVPAASINTIAEDCEVILPTDESLVFAYSAFVFGSFNVNSTVTGGLGPTVRNCVVFGGQVAVLLISLNGGVVEGVTHSGMICSQFGSRSIFAVLRLTALAAVRGPRFSDCLVTVAATGDAQGASAFGYTVENDATIDTPSYEDFVMEGCRFECAAGIANTQLHAYRTIVGNGGTGKVQKGVIADSVSVNSMVGVKIDTGTNDATDGTSGSINDIVVSAVQNIGLRTTSNTPIGFDLEIDNVPTNKKINRITIVGSNAAGLTAGTAVVINSSGIVNTIVSSNQLTPNGGAAILDNGTNSQIIGNIVT